MQAHDEGDRSLLEAHEDGKDEARGGENVEKPSSAQEEIRQQRSAGLQYMSIDAKGVKISTDQFSPPKKLAPKNTQKIHKNTQNSTVFRVLFPKISTGQKKQHRLVGTFLQLCV